MEQSTGIIKPANTLKRYKINETFHSLQGEGVRAGTSNIFIRFTGCNLQCNGQEVDQAYQPICDTEFSSGTFLTAGEILEQIRKLADHCRSIIFTGGEPTLQLDGELITLFKEAGYYLAIETNGTKEVPSGLDWICVSPKTAEHTLQQLTASEVKYVRHQGQGIPKPRIKADHYLISPAFEPGGTVPRGTLDHCIALCKDNPPWRLSLQLHKIWNVR